MIKYSHADRTNTVACFRAPYLLNRLCIILAGHHRIIIFNTGKQNAKLWRPRGWLTKTPGFPATHYILLYVMRGPWRCRSDPNKGPSLWHLERSQAADMKMCLSNTHQFIWSTGVNPQTKSNVPAEHIVSSVISKKKKKRKEKPQNKLAVKGVASEEQRNQIFKQPLTPQLSLMDYIAIGSNWQRRLTTVWLMELKSKSKPMKSLPNCKFNGTMQKDSTGLIKAKKWWTARKFWMTSDQTLLGCSSCKVANS